MRIFIDGAEQATNLPRSPTFDAIQFNTSAVALPNAEGLLQWNSTDGTLDLGMDGGKTTQQIGQELFIKVINKSNATIDNGTPVYVSGRQGNLSKIYSACGNSEATSRVIGLATEDLDNDEVGFITIFGYVRQIKTNYSGTGIWGGTWVSGDKLFVSKSVTGQLTNIEPSTPHCSDMVGTVAIVGANGIGSIFVDIQRHSTLEELSDVNGTLLTENGQLPVWDSVRGVFDFNYNITDYQLKNLSVTGVSDAYPISITDDAVICNSSSPLNVTLPTPSIGAKVIIKNIGSGTVTIIGNDFDTIDGSPNKTLSQWASLMVLGYASDKWATY